MRDVIVIGGGLAGLFNSILLSRDGLKVTLVEKNAYPFHRVCGEYISNEVAPFLKRVDLYPAELNPAQLTQLQISSINGRSFHRRLGLGGFGISRYSYDHWLANKAIASGAEIIQGVKAGRVERANNAFHVQLSDGRLISSRLVISAHGKRSTLDREMNRSFLKKRSPFVGVKYHIETDLPADLIALHNFEGGYCGVSQVEGSKFNLCYLADREKLKVQGSIDALEKNILFANPLLHALFKNSKRLFETPAVINEISFEKKEPVLDHIFFSGDSAGLITPLCGNGMAMAIVSAKILSETIRKYWDGDKLNYQEAEREYAAKWKSQFQSRLWAGRRIQSLLFGNQKASNLAVNIGKRFGKMTDFLISQTHGKPIN